MTARRETYCQYHGSCMAYAWDCQFCLDCWSSTTPMWWIPGWYYSWWLLCSVSSRTSIFPTGTMLPRNNKSRCRVHVHTCMKLISPSIILFLSQYRIWLTCSILCSFIIRHVLTLLVYDNLDFVKKSSTCAMRYVIPNKAHTMWPGALYYSCMHHILSHVLVSFNRGVLIAWIHSTNHYRQEYSAQLVIEIH